MKSSTVDSVFAAPDSKILVRGVNWLGDAVMTTPALMRLREAFPRSPITLLTPGKLKDIWIGHPAVDDVLTVQSSVWKTASVIRRGGFKTALILPNSPRSALETWLAQVPVRIGAGRGWRNWLLTHAVPCDFSKPAMRKKTIREIQQVYRQESGARQTFPADSHQVLHYLSLVAFLGADSSLLPPVLRVSEDEIEPACERFGFGKIGNRPVFALNPGAEYGPAKRWPGERFAKAAVEIQKQTDCLWLILGGKQDFQIAFEIANKIRLAAPEALVPSAICIAGKTTLRDLCVVLKRSFLLLTNDTGPMHLAAALGTPVIVPFGSTSPELTGPGMPGDPRHRLLMGQVPCAPCFLRECPVDFRCMHSIGADAVASAVMQVWREASK